MLKAAAIFGNGMILQQDTVVAVWGETDCKYVEVEFDGSRYEASIIDGKWFASVHTAKADRIQPGKEVRTYSMLIKGSESRNGACTDEIGLHNIRLGEVWMAGGQSNMELELKDSMNGEQVALQSHFPDISFYNVPKCAMEDSELWEAESRTSWKIVSGEDCKYMSAVAYYFALAILKSINVPVGIIDCYWGGTSATCWVDRATLSDVPKAAEFIKGWDDDISSKTPEQYAKEMDDYNNELLGWQNRLEALRAKDPDVGWVDINEIVGPYPWPVPRGYSSPFRPFGLHKTMVERIAPYGVKGFIYYQAEEDGERADFYSELNSAVIRQWRADFHTEGDEYEKPFYITQLPMFIANNVPDDKQWCILRQQQELCAETNINTGIAVISDCGEFDNIHPLDKKTPGQRLASQVLLGVYGMEQEDGGLHNLKTGEAKAGGLHNLKASKADFYGDRCELSFDKTYGGLCYRASDGETLTALDDDIMLTDGAVDSGIIYGFEISSDGVDYRSPAIEIDGDRIIARSADGSEIRYIRYGWFNYGVANLYSMAGVPLMPFSIEK